MKTFECCDPSIQWCQRPTWSLAYKHAVERARAIGRRQRVGRDGYLGTPGFWVIQRAAS
jgi:hypothetical protein